MRNPALLLLVLVAAVPASGQQRVLTEDAFRGTLNLASWVKLQYRDLQCKPMAFEDFVDAMHEPGVNSQIERAADGSSVTLTIHRRGQPSCPSPYPPLAEMPAFDLKDLHGVRVTSAQLRGKPTLLNFYFADCKPCILEVGPLNRYAASRPDMNFLAVTFDAPSEARAFVQRYKFAWRVLPDAREFIDRMRVKNYPLMALFDAHGRLLGVKAGGVRDELEAAAVEPRLRRWVNSLIPPPPKPTATP